LLVITSAVNPNLKVGENEKTVVWTIPTSGTQLHDCILIHLQQMKKLALSFLLALVILNAAPPSLADGSEPGLLFYLSGDHELSRLAAIDGRPPPSI
jgi:hypothetical protein